MPAKRTRDSFHASRPVDPEWDAKCESTWQHLLARSESGGTFTAKQLFTALGVGYNRVRAVLDRAVADGRLVHIGVRVGYTCPGLITDAVTLESLLGAAARAVDPAAKGAPGRRATDMHERIETVTPGQFKRMRAAAAVAGEALGGDRGMRGVSSEHFGWVPCATGEPDRGAWTLVDVVARASDEQARAAHLASGSAAPWDPKSNEAARNAHTGGIRLLLNFGFTHGYIAGTTRLGAEYGVHAAELHPWVEAMTAALSEAARSQSMRYNHADGVRVLALHRTRTGQLDDRHVDWARVIHSIEAASLADIVPLSATKLSNAKGAYRALRRASRIAGPGWGARPDHTPEGLMSTTSIERAAETGDFSEWRVSSVDEEGEPALVFPTAFASADAVRAPYSLHRYYQWVDSRNTDAALARLNLPERSYLDPDAQQAKNEIKARRKGKPLFANVTSTIQRNLTLLNAYAGWAARSDGVDLTTVGLDALVDEARFLRYCAHWQSQHPDAAARGGRASWLSQLAALLGTIASPFLARLGLAQGDQATAKGYVALARRLFHHSLKLEPNTSETSSGKAKIAAWQCRGDDTEPVDHLRAIRNVMIDDIERLGGGAVSEQIAAIRAGTHRVIHRQKWAVLVRDAAILSCQVRVALRSANLCGLCHIGPRQTWFVANGRQPWEGWIHYEFPAGAMKMAEPFGATLISERDAKTADACADLRPDLLELLLMSGGARDALLTYRQGDGVTRVAPSDHVFPVVAASGKPSERRARIQAGCPMTVGALNALFHRRIRAYAPRVGLDVRKLEAVYGGASPHVCRALVYTAAANAGEARAGAESLAHTNGTLTGETHYRGKRGATPDEIRRRRMGSSGCPATPTELVAQALALVAAGKLSQPAYEATVRALQPASSERAA